MNKTVIPTLVRASFIDRMLGQMKLCGYNPLTIKAYIRQAKNFIRFNRAADLGSVTERDIQSYLNLLIENGLSRSTIDQAAKAMEILYYELSKNSLDLSGLKRPQKRRPAPVVLTSSEVRLIACNSKTIRNSLMIELAYSAGLRVSELVEIKKEHLDLDKLTLCVPGFEKNRRTVFLSKHLKDSLVKQVGTKNNSQYLFPGERGGALTTRAVAKFFKKALVASGLKKLATPHSLRQSFAQAMSHQEVDPVSLQNTFNPRTLTLPPSPDSKKAA